jgi:hypothetical protein
MLRKVVILKLRSIGYMIRQGISNIDRNKMFSQLLLLAGGAVVFFVILALTGLYSLG